MNFLKSIKSILSVLGLSALCVFTVAQAQRIAIIGGGSDAIDPAR